MNYKKLLRLLPIPVLLLIVCAIYLLFLIQANQIAMGIDFKGGTQIIISSDKQVSDVSLENVLKQYDAKVTTARGITSYTVFIEFDASINSQDVLNTLKQNGYTFSQYSIQTIGPNIAANFFQQALIVIAFSIIFMAITVLVMFRTPMPSIFLILTVIGDLVETIVLMQIIGIALSIATFAGFLSLIGAAVGDNILFTTKLLKSSPENYDAIIKKTFKTGMTMFAAVQVAFAALLIVSASAVITQIAAISIIGGFLDVMNSWVLNLGLMMLYLTRKIK